MSKNQEQINTKAFAALLCNLFEIKAHTKDLEITKKSGKNATFRLSTNVKVSTRKLVKTLNIYAKYFLIGDMFFHQTITAPLSSIETDFRISSDITFCTDHFSTFQHLCLQPFVPHFAHKNI